MQSSDSERFIDIMESISDNVRSYSGRFMYDAECCGVVVEDISQFIADVIDYIADDSTEAEIISTAFRGMRTDNMGLNTIVYFPRVKWPEDRVSLDEEED